ncbi:hypothetical protein STHAL_32915 [Streptomyces halstedii]|uniref:Uncharacterized protein n=1 Tax=Streptomyces halstedii TaxID=1944 RepID=A0ABS6U1I8_STRHA|nr:hypothetical protein [Streptomyces halstedii]MBV7674249.1 hypothetical protein [Streptomyces halstedii]
MDHPDERQQPTALRSGLSGRPRHRAEVGVALKDKGVPAETADKLTIKVGKNVGKSPSLYRAFTEAEAAVVDEGLPLRPTPVRIRRAGEPLAAEEIELRERLQAQPRPNAETR